MEAVQADPSLLATLMNPFSLSDGFQGPEQPGGNEVMEEEISGGWVAPFFMAPINTKNIHRSNALTGHRYGEDFVYDEMFFAGPGDSGHEMAKVMASMGVAAGGDEGPKPPDGTQGTPRGGLG